MKNLRANLDELREAGMLRRLQPLTGRAEGHVNRDGVGLVNLSSNDYLGLAGDLTFLEEFYQQKKDGNLQETFGLGVASSRLLTGDVPVAHELEALLADLYGREKALLFNSGYHANIGIIPALFGRNDLILSDKLNHASIHDGLRVCRAEYKRYRHRDTAHLKTLLEKYRSSYDNVLIVSESVFSMDGDCANLPALVELKKQYDCLLYLDEAHSIGLYGENGLGIAEQEGLIAEIDLLVGTFGKACGSVGAYLLSSAEVCDYLINRSRSLIFTTALPPVVLSWNLFVMKRIPQLKQHRQHLQDISSRLRSALASAGLRTRGETNIVPVIIGSASQTVDGAQYLQERGYYVLPVRPPTVPEGSSRFRLSLTADLRYEQLEQLPELISTWLERTT